MFDNKVIVSDSKSGLRIKQYAEDSYEIQERKMIQPPGAMRAVETWNFLASVKTAEKAIDTFELYREGRVNTLQKCLDNAWEKAADRLTTEMFKEEMAR